MVKRILYYGKTGEPEKPYLHFFETEFQVQMCASDFFKGDLKEGRGNLVRGSIIVYTKV